jgi:hypothetical protein
LPLISDVPFYDLFIKRTYRLGKIAVRPQTVSPQEFFQLRVGFAYDSTRSTLQYLHDLGHAFSGPELDDEVDMVFLHRYFFYPPSIHLAGFKQKLFYMRGYFASQYPFSILRYPD